MTTRILRRKVIIREYDFNKVKEQSLRPMNCMGVPETLYDRVSFMPIDEANLEKLKMLDVLKGKNTPITTARWNYTNPALLLYDLRDYLYNDKYYDWNVTTDEDGFVCVQSRSNTPKSRIGWGVFEKDLKCRI